MAENLTVSNPIVNGNGIANFGGTIISSADISVMGLYDAIQTYGGTLTINGGNVTASYGYGITAFNRGYDNESAGANVTINGGCLRLHIMH